MMQTTALPSKKGEKCVSGSSGSYGGGFALVVVLFILLIIIGASWF
jgi:uncharacterized protein (TIGR01732 family)